MGNISRLLLLVLALSCSSTIFAQIKVVVLIEGVDAEFEQNIRLFLSIAQQKIISNYSDSRLLLLHNKAEREINKALQPFGYYQPKVNSSFTKNITEFDDEHWLAHYTIDVGQPVRIADYNFKISGYMHSDPEFKSLVEQYTLKKGDVFNHILYEKFKSELTVLAAERGYLAAKFVKHQVRIDLDSKLAYVELHYQGGLRYQFGDVLLKQDVLDPEFLSRYIPFKKGDPYTFSTMLGLQQALSDSNYFRTVEVSPGKIREDSVEIPVTVLVTPRKRNRYSIGLGYGTDTRARAKFIWEIPQLNRSGHRINTEAKISELGYSFSAQYRVPIFNPRTDQFIYSTKVVNEKTTTSENTVSAIGASINYSRGKWRESVALNFEQETFIIANEQNKKRSLIPSISWNRLWGNNLIHIFDGLRFDINFRGASDNWFSDTSFFQSQGSLKGITPLGTSNRLIAYGRLGSTWVDDVNDLPKSLRFFAGGASSVRGYGFESLGPVNNEGVVIGGKYLMVGTLEFEHSFTRQWGAAMFIDAGNAINDLDDKLVRGAGFGLRWKSPIGPIRIDIANALSSENRPWRLHITIGPDL